MTTAYRISSVRSASGELKVWRTITWGQKSLKGMRNRLLKIQTFITRHYIILTSLLYRVRTLTSHDTEESENSPESPHLGEIKRMRKQCVPGASPFFARAGDEAMLDCRTNIYYLMGEKAIWLDIARVCGRIFTSRRRVKIQHKSAISSHIAFSNIK